ncbi:MAG: hypothetical protein R2715_11585 [Ilumatobacteraceae bacterium]
MTISRRSVLAAGGAAALATTAARPTPAAAAVSGQLVTLLDPIRVYDSRSDTTLLGGSRLASGSSILVTVSAAYEGFVSAVFANITATDTVGWDSSVCGADGSGTLPHPRRPT